MLPKPSVRIPLMLTSLLLVSGVLLALPADAATFTWSNASGGSWSNASNWSPSGVPAAGDAAALPDLGGYTVTLDANASLSALIIGSGTTLTMASGNALSLSGAALQNDGLLVVGPSASNVLRLTTTGGNVHIAGTGVIEMQGQGSIDAPRSKPMLHFRVYNESGHTIRGVGTVGVPIDNAGRIEHVGGGLLTLGQYLWNSGTVRVADGGRINVRYTVSNNGGTIEGHDGWFTVQPTDQPDDYNYGPIDNLAGGTFVADGGNLDIKAGVVAGGTIVRDGGVGVVGFHDTGNPNNLVVTEGAEVLLDGGTGFHIDTPNFENHGTVRVRGTLWLGTSVGDTANTASDGTIVLEGGTLMGGRNMAGLDQWILNNGHITGCGTIAGGFINAGTVTIDCPTLYEDITSAKFVNRGRITVSRGYLRALGASAVVRNLGVIDGANGGVLVEQGATLDNRGGVLNAGRSGVALGRGGTSAAIVGGTLSSSGGVIMNHGAATLRDLTLAPGAPLYTLNRAVTTATGANFVHRGINAIEAGGAFVTDPATDYVHPEGAIVMRGGSITVPRGLVVRGSLSGVGTVIGKLVNEGEVAPGASATGLQVQGDYVQAKTARLLVGIGGYEPNQFGRLTVSGSAELDGTVRAARTDGFVPELGRAFDVLAAATRVGEFGLVDADPGLALSALYEVARVALVTPSPLGVDEPAAPPRALRFAPRGTGFALELPAAAEVDVRAFDVMGRQVAVLAHGARPAGVHALALRDELPSGVYFARAVVRSGERAEERHARLLRIR